jgi:hypothetical protein
LETTPHLHNSGQFKLVHASSDPSEARSEVSESPMEGELVMKFDTEQPITQDGPFKLVTYSDECRNFLHFEIRGRSTTLPELQL